MISPNSMVVTLMEIYVPPKKRNRQHQFDRECQKQEANGLEVIKGVTCHNIFFISAFNHWSKWEDIFIIFTNEAVVRCWCYWRGNSKFLLHFLTGIIPEKFTNLFLIYSQYLLCWINRPMPPVLGWQLEGSKLWLLGGSWGMLSEFPFMECAVLHISSFVQQQLYE